ncbi:hypothetical protein G6F57_020384 [Rhizopus arrhizus]|nr:hypothetical protein G6F57_020384 [Rhizopus arrhizus]
MARHRTDVAAVQVHTDRHAIREGVGHEMDVALFRRQAFDVTRLQGGGLARGRQLAVRMAHVALIDFGAAQHAHIAPDLMVMHRRELPWSPDETDQRKPLQRIAMQQELLLVLRLRRGTGLGQPIVVAHQVGEGRFQRRRLRQPVRGGQARRGGDKTAKPVQTG